MRAYANTCWRVATKYLCLGHAETLSRVIRLNRISLARLAQSAERKALNLVVVGSSPTVGAILYKSNELIAVAGVKMLRVRIELKTLGL